MSRRHDLAIVGLGPTGATLALLAARQGLTVEVFERSREPFSQPRACHLDAEIARVLQNAGLAARLADLLTVSHGMEYVDAEGRRLFSFEGFERAPLLGWAEDHVFVQPELEGALRSELASRESVTMHVGVEAPTLEELLTDADWVVACDGASSALRQEIGVPVVDLGYDERWMVIDIEERPGLPLELPTIIQQVCDPARLATFVPSHGGHRRWEFALSDDESPDPWHLLERWGVRPDNAVLLRTAVYRFHALVAAEWRGGPDGRVLLAGDAAHQMPPFMGQGLCSGVRDAANLAWKLSAVQSGRADASIIGTYEAERRPHVTEVTRLSVDAGRLLRDLADDLAAGRTLRLPDPDVPDTHRWSRLPGLDLGAPFPVGHLVPQPERADAAYFDDLLGDGWSIVVDDEAVVPERLALARAATPAPTASDLDTAPVVVDARATYGSVAVLVRPDRYIAAAV